jgi:Arc/MetJ family transcription regulator
MQVCDASHMATNLAIDDTLIEAARTLGAHRTKREAVTVALEEYVRKKRQLAILELAGRVEFVAGYDAKRDRRKRKRKRK